MTRTDMMTAAVALGATLTAAACAGDGGAAGPQAYVYRLGNDTLAMEILTRLPGRIEGRVLIRQPNTRVGTYTITLGRGGMPTGLDVHWETPAAGGAILPPLHAVATVEDDAIRVDVRPGDRRDTTLLVERGERTLLDAAATPLSAALWSQSVALARASGDSSWDFSVVSAAMRPGPVANRIVLLGGDSVSMDYHGDPMVARVDGDGTVEWIDGRATTFKIQSERVPAEFDFDSIAADFASRDARGEGFGPASPRGTFEVSGGGAHFTVEYSRPSVRGRAIWGALVPYGVTWRTGANAATHFSTNRDLLIGGARVPAGTYTLWTTFTADTDTLIISTQNRVWGTNYDPSKDLVRVPLERSELAEPVEMFTIAIEPTDRGGTLQLMWDRRLLTAKMRVAR